MGRCGAIMQTLKKPTTFFLIGICLWGILLYANTLRVPFVFDDNRFIVQNSRLLNIESGALWGSPEYRKRFVAFLSFALNYRFHKLDVAGYHVVNLTIHLLTTLSIFWLVLLLFQTPRMKREEISKDRQTVALLSGWLFVSHPIQTEAVTYISQRFECMAALFYLSAVCWYIKARLHTGSEWKGTGFFLVSALSAGAGLLTKETVFTLPAVLILIEGLFFNVSLPDAGTKEKRAKEAEIRWVYFGMLLLGCVLLFFVFSFDPFKIFTLHNNLGITSGTYLLTQFRVIVKYLQLLFWPLRQNLDYDFPLSSGLLDGPTLLSLLCLLSLLFAGFKAIRRYPLIGFGILWFFLTLSITSSIIPIRDVIAEHRLYLPSVGFAIACVAGLFYLFRDPRIPVLCLAGIILFFSLLTHQRNAVWADDVALWKDAVQKSPEKARPYANLAHAYRLKGEKQSAVESYLKALRRKTVEKNDEAHIFMDLGTVYGDLEEYEKAIYCFREALAINGNVRQAYYNLVFAYAMLGDYKEAAVYGRVAVTQYPRMLIEELNALGEVYLLRKEYISANSVSELVLALSPHNPRAEKNLQDGKMLLQATISSSEHG